MKRILSMFLVTFLVMSCISTIAFASEETSLDLDDVISNNEEAETTNNAAGTDTSTESSTASELEEENKNFIASLNDAADLSNEVEGVAEVNAGIKLVASWIIQIISYAIITLLALRIVLDLAYIGLPFTRAFLANGYVGNAQAGAGGMPNSMAGGMGGMAGGMPGMGGMGGMNNGMMGNGMMGGGMYNRGGYGMNRGYGMGGMAGGMGGMGGMEGSANQGSSIMGRIQWVSNAALNAVASESTVGPDGKANSPFKHYWQDMALMLVLVPILLTLAVTGTLTNLGFLLGDVIVDAIASIGDMI